MNPLAVGDKIKHPPVGVPANVVFVDIVVERKFLPSNLYRYIPNMTTMDDDNLNIMGVVTLVDLEDDTELFVDYWNVFSVDLKTLPDWMTIPPDNLGKLFVKRKYEHQIPLALEVAREIFVPQTIINRFDLEQLVQKEIKELTTPSLLEQKRLLEESQAQKQLESRAVHSTEPKGAESEGEKRQ